MGFSQLWKKIRKTETFRPARIIIPSQNIHPPLRNSEAFKRNEQYFEVRINQMYLTENRAWFTTWEPVVLVGTTFLYDGKLQEVPNFIGQQTMKGDIKKVPQGMIYEQKKVAGLHPYRGDDFTISIILGRAKREDYLRKVIKIIENVSNTYLGSFGSAVLPYVNVAKVIVDSFEDLVDSQDVEPIIGHETTLNPDTGNGFYPGYFVLINEDEMQVNPNHFFVKDSKLCYGESIDTAIPYRNDDYVLYSILAAETRSDVEKLPYYDEFRKLTEEFIGKIQGKITEEQEKNIKARLAAVCYKVFNSPDLNRAQVMDQITEFKTQITTMIDITRSLSGSEQNTGDPRDDWEKSIDDQLSNLLS